jgi:hypothetical protein
MAMKLYQAKYILDCPPGWRCKVNGDVIIYIDENLPAVGYRQIVFTFKNGMLLYCDFLQNGLLHREDGPAVTVHDEDGSIINEFYYINGSPQRHSDK